MIVVAGLLMAGCQEPPPWTPVRPDETVHSMLDIPLRQLHQHPENYIGTVFEGQFKFYRIYHNKEDADPKMRGQVILGKTHFTARPINQYLQAIQIQITPPQEAWMRAQGIQRQDAIRARVRFVGLVPGDALGFELLEILDTPKHMRRI
jgi:hypothetical protein